MRYFTLAQSQAYGSDKISGLFTRGESFEEMLAHQIIISMNKSKTLESYFFKECKKHLTWKPSLC